ncbi:MAG: penicillin acylase family protein [candidate division KSB1 bacterium]|nr:penicillin acylase family protein [candidate division KSB1 bacterium]
MLWLCILLTGLLLNLPPTDAATQLRKETLFLPGLRQSVQILIDRHGVPHMYASTASDAFFALGYLHAHDRLLEMEFLRRRARGELAELLGPDYFEADLLMRQLGIRRSSEAAWRSDRFPSHVRTAIEAYCQGVNAYIAHPRQSPWRKSLAIPISACGHGRPSMY